MTLSGNLGFVPIDEILRLLTRSKQEGAVVVSGDGLRGRVFVGRGGIDLATTSEDDVLHRHLVNSGYAQEDELRRVTTGGTTLAALAESNQSIVDLLREMTVESLFQISDRGGEFQVREGQATPYASPKSFELEALLEDAHERSKEWAKVSDVVPDLGRAIRLRRDLGQRDEVSVKNDDWKVLSEVGAGKSVAEIADHLGTTEFWTARAVARLVTNELVEIEAAPQGDEWSKPEPASTADDYYPVDVYDGHEEPVADSTQAVEPVDFGETAEEETQHDESWWEEPEEDEAAPVTEAAASGEGEVTPEVVSEGLSEIPAVESTEDDEDVEEDTEAFLEKVFSELESDESDESDSEQGHGLLRRRRMGTLRDFSSDS